MQKYDQQLLNLPSYRDTLTDSISRAYFRREIGHSKENLNPNLSAEAQTQEASQTNHSKSNILRFRRDEKLCDENRGIQSSERLYLQGVISHISRGKIAAQKKETDMAQQLVECSFRPKIKSVSDKEDFLRERIGTSELLYDNAKEKQKKLELRREIKKIHEEMQMQSKPRINHVSDMLVHLKRQNLIDQYHALQQGQGKLDMLEEPSSCQDSYRKPFGLVQEGVKIKQSVSSSQRYETSRFREGVHITNKSRPKIQNFFQTAEIGKIGKNASPDVKNSSSGSGFRHTVSKDIPWRGVREVSKFHVSDKTKNCLLKRSNSCCLFSEETIPATTSTHQSLYIDAFEREKKRSIAKLNRTLGTFQPKINPPLSKKKAENTNYLEGGFFERMRYFDEKRKENLALANLEEQRKSQVDKRTGQKYFAPHFLAKKVSQSRKSEKIRKQLNIKTDSDWKGNLSLQIVQPSAGRPGSTKSNTDALPCSTVTQIKKPKYLEIDVFKNKYTSQTSRKNTTNKKKACSQNTAKNGLSKDQLVTFLGRLKSIIRPCEIEPVLTPSDFSSKNRSQQVIGVKSSSLDINSLRSAGQFFIEPSQTSRQSKTNNQKLDSGKAVSKMTVISDREVDERSTQPTSSHLRDSKCQIFTRSPEKSDIKPCAQEPESCRKLLPLPEEKPQLVQKNEGQEPEPNINQKTVDYQNRFEAQEPISSEVDFRFQTEHSLNQQIFKIPSDRTNLEFFLTIPPETLETEASSQKIQDLHEQMVEPTIDSQSRCQNLEQQHHATADSQKDNFNSFVENLFLKLDTDGDGLISCDRISIEFIDKQTLKLISPILFELEELNQTLTATEFKKSMLQLMKKLSPSSQQELIFKEEHKTRKIIELSGQTIKQSAKVGDFSDIFSNPRSSPRQGMDLS